MQQCQNYRDPQYDGFHREDPRYSDPQYREFLGQRRAQILDSVASAARECDRDPSEIDVICVSKTVDIEQVKEAHEAGWNQFAENRPQELMRKTDALPDLSFDMIGNLQTNKINHVLGRARLIHSVASLELAAAVEKRAQAHGLIVKALLEVNVLGEATKSGFSPQELARDAEALAALEHLRFCGLMAMAPAHDKTAAQKCFEGLRNLRDEQEGRMGCALRELSCGMSDDYMLAIVEGSTMARLGRIVFDPNYAFDVC